MMLWTCKPNFKTNPELAYYLGETHDNVSFIQVNNTVDTGN